MNRKYCIEVMLFLTYALFAMSWVAGSMMTKPIMAFYQIESIASATWATNAITVAKILGNLAAASVLVKLGIKKAFILASLLIVAGAIGAFTSEYIFYVISRLIIGFGGALVIVYFNPIVVHYFTAEERPLINGINAAAFNTGNLLALLFTTTLLSAFDNKWQNVIIAISIISLIILVICLFVIEDFSLEKKTENTNVITQNYTLKEGMKDAVNWWLPITYSGLLFCYIAIFSLFPLIPTFAVTASKLSAIIISAGMLGTLVGIIASKRYSYRLPIIRFSGIIMTLCAAIMIKTSIPILAYTTAFGAGFFMFVPMTALISLAQELPDMTSQRVTVIFSMFWSISYAIATILMVIAGKLADFTGNITIAAYFAVACSATFFIGSFFLPETGKAKKLSH